MDQPVRGTTKTILTASVMLATILQVLDSTVANVALPHIQAALSATQDEGAWVLSSYFTASAVMFPLSAWLANGFGSRQVFLISVAGFIAASLLCGMATSLPALVFFRILQGLSGAALAPLSQALLFEINRKEDYGRAMALWGAGITLGPILGFVLGGWLTENFSWRWVFYINLPLGILALAGLYASLPRRAPAKPPRFDLFGFVSLSVGVASLQLMLDRGQLLDWFASREIVLEAASSALGFYLFLVHTLSTPKPFVNPALFRDRNFVSANIFLFLIGVVLFANLALHPTLLQEWMHYPVLLSGLVLAPRGLGTIIGMFAVGRLVPRFDARLVMGAALLLTALSLGLMGGYSLLMGPGPVIAAGLLNATGIGALNVALATVGFLTLPAHLRNEGAALSNLVRNTGGAIGISVMVFILTRNTQRAHAVLSEHVTPYDLVNPALVRASVNIHSTAGLMRLDRLITDQSAMLAYIGDFRLMMVLTLLALPCLVLFRPRNPRP